MADAFQTVTYEGGPWADQSIDVVDPDSMPTAIGVEGGRYDRKNTKYTFTADPESDENPAE